MRRIYRGTAAIPLPLAFILLVLLPLGCGSNGSDSDPRGLPLVVASIYPLGDLVQTVAGDMARVEVVLPAGASPATFDITPRQMVDYQGASLFFMIGGGLDEWISRIPEGAEGSASVVRLSDGMHLLAGEEEEEEGMGGEHDHDHGAGNPHIWLDPILVRDEIVPRIEAALLAAFPGNAQGIRDRASLLTASLTALDGDIREVLDPLEQRAFIATHSAWTYFANRYGLEEAGVIHAHPGQDPSSREMARLLEVARSRSLQCLFTEPQLGEVAVRAIASELSLPTCLLDPLGGPGMEGRSHYLDLLMFNASQLAKGLGGPVQ